VLLGRRALIRARHVHNCIGHQTGRFLLPESFDKLGFYISLVLVLCTPEKKARRRDPEVEDNVELEQEDSKVDSMG
jgi:hypothetical protein